MAATGFERSMVYLSPKILMPTLNDKYTLRHDR